MGFQALTALRAEASEHLLLAHVNHFWTKMSRKCAPLAVSYSVHELVMGVPREGSGPIDQQP